MGRDLNTAQPYLLIYGLYFYMCFGLFSVKTGEDGMQRQEHAGSIEARSFHYGAARGILHRAVDRWLCLPEPYQVRTNRVVLTTEVEKLSSCV